MGEPLLSMRGITKRFPGVVANDAVDLHVYPGEIHALLGENGAGKSTLMNILSGIYYPNEGAIFYQGKEVVLNSPRDAVHMGIGMVHQHYRLVETLSVAENISLYANTTGALLQKKQTQADIKAFADSYELPIDPAACVGDLSVGEQQRVEILKLLYRGAELLILDEPTAVLTPQDSESLFRALRRMADAGKTVLLISHKMEEIMRSADRITILRQGKSVGTFPIRECSVEKITDLMIGHAVHDTASDTREAPPESAPRVLRLENVCVKNNLGVQTVKNASLTIRAGEIMGLAGVAGNGQQELAEAIAGLRAISNGQIFLHETPLQRNSVRQATAHKIAYVPDDRMGTGLVGPLDIPQNLILKHFRQAQFSRRGLLRHKEVNAYARELSNHYDIRHAGIHKPVSLMSGGNMQKLLLAREISADPELIIAACPTRGLDIGATESVHEILLAQRACGAAILLISEDLDEIFRLCDKIAVICGGEIIDIVATQQTTVQDIGLLMTGIRKEAAI